MATLIVQKPLKEILPVGQDVIFTVSNNSNIVQNETRVKFIAEVHISSGNPINPSTNNDLVGTFKTTPNDAGVGMFDFAPIIESFVNADNKARFGSAYKGTVNTLNFSCPIHLVDKFSGNIDTFRYLAIVFRIEYLGANAAYPNSVNIDTGEDKNSDEYQVFNGYLKYENELKLVGNDFGFDVENKFAFGSFGGVFSTANFLSNAPTTQYANLEDYGTLGMLLSSPFSSSNPTGSTHIEMNYFSSTGGYLGTEDIYHSAANGAFTYPNSDIVAQMLFVGIFPANLQGSSTIFAGLVTAGTIQGGYYTLAVLSDFGVLSQIYTINLNCPTLKGYEPIRLAWLNQWGAWDYYTFTQKSTKTISTKGSTYRQLEGTWNKASYKIDSFKGGKKSFRVNATEKITMNTDFVSEAESEWFVDLINSPEVYILEGFQDDTVNSSLNKYVTPVRLTTSSFNKKTVANDKLIQYTFEVEKSKTLRTQSI